MRATGIVAVAIALLPLGVPSLTAQQAIQLRWGLESKNAYVQVPPLFAAMNAFGEQGRNYPIQRAYVERLEGPMFDQAAFCDKRHWDLWEEYKQRNAVRSQQAFQELKKQRDPNCIKLAQELAPRLYFDFVAASPLTHVLDRIVTRTLAFGEYRGGGFVAKETEYDLILPHMAGVKTHMIEPRLEFTGTGRVVLRFWSDNYYPSVGWIAPRGAYVLEITFVFLVGGKEVQVSTGVFLIDV